MIDMNNRIQNEEIITSIILTFSTKNNNNKKLFQKTKNFNEHCLLTSFSFSHIIIDIQIFHEFIFVLFESLYILLRNIFMILNLYEKKRKEKNEMFDSKGCPV